MEKNELSVFMMLIKLVSVDTRSILKNKKQKQQRLRSCSLWFVVFQISE